MSTIRLGTIGTSSITNIFVEAAHLTKEFKLKAVYSRTLEKARAFGEPHAAENYFDNLEEFLKSSDLDVIYVSSPNSLHFKQTVAALNAGKHVIVEKPAFTEPKHWEIVSKLAEEKGRFVIEAVRHIQEPNFSIVKKEIEKLEDIQGATLPFMSYSSRYDLVKNGEEPNIFSPAFAGGALMDLGVYPIYNAIGWFGEPESVHGFVQKIKTGVDGKGTAILRYPSFDVIVIFGKTATTTLPAEIYGVDATLRLNHITQINKIEKIDSKTGSIQEIPVEPVALNMLFDEARNYAEVLKNPNSVENQRKVKEWFHLSEIVGRTVFSIREQAGVKFPFDNE